MSALSFTIPGEPKGKGRPRIVKIGGLSRLAADKKTVSYEGLVALAAERALAGRTMLDGPLSLHVTVRLCPARSASRKVAAAMLAGEIAPTKKPDLDNVIKAVLDGCNGVAFRDDVLVTRISASKVYAACPGVDVEIAPALAPVAAANAEAA
jgi:Holliday junction resolvase RusA-like endonuclease